MVQIATTRIWRRLSQKFTQRQLEVQTLGDRLATAHHSSDVYFARSDGRAYKRQIVWTQITESLVGAAAAGAVVRHRRDTENASRYKRQNQLLCELDRRSAEIQQWLVGLVGPAGLLAAGLGLANLLGLLGLLTLGY